MPLLLEPVDVLDELSGVSSVLIASCPICPAFSLTMREATPLLSFSRGVPRLIALQDHVVKLRQSLEARGVHTDAFTIYAPLPMMCLWTEHQRKRLVKRAWNFEAVLVLGCESAAYTVAQTLEGSCGRVIQAMRVVGITNATVGYEPPMKLVLQDPARVPVKVMPPGADSEACEKDTKETIHE